MVTKGTLREYIALRLASLKEANQPHSFWRYLEEENIKGRISELQDVLDVMDATTHSSIPQTEEAKQKGLITYPTERKVE